MGTAGQRQPRNLVDEFRSTFNVDADLVLSRQVLRDTKDGKIDVCKIAKRIANTSEFRSAERDAGQITYDGKTYLWQMFAVKQRPPTSLRDIFLIADSYDVRPIIDKGVDGTFKKYIYLKRLDEPPHRLTFV